MANSEELGLTALLRCHRHCCRNGGRCSPPDRPDPQGDRAERPAINPEVVKTNLSRPSVVASNDVTCLCIEEKPSLTPAGHRAITTTPVCRSLSTRLRRRSCHWCRRPNAGPGTIVSRAGASPSGNQRGFQIRVLLTIQKCRTVARKTQHQVVWCSARLYRVDRQEGPPGPRKRSKR